MFFGGNVTAPGLNGRRQLQFDARHQLVGFASFGDEGMKNPAQLSASAAGNRSGYIAPAERWQAANILALSEVVATTSASRTQATFAYRQGMYALYYFNSTNYFLDNPSLLWHDDQGKICWYPYGALYNFTAEGFESAFMTHVIEELCDEAAHSGVNAVFFDGVDGLSRMPPHGSPFSTNCSIDRLHLNPSDYEGMMIAQAKVFARAAARLNQCGIWPMYSFGNAIDPDISRSRGYPASLKVSLDILKESNATWARYYEFWEAGPWGVSSGYGIRNAVQEAQLYGIPLAAHAYPAGTASGGSLNTSATYSVAAFLIAQTEYSYYGVSDVEPSCEPPAKQWSDCGWTWHKEYDFKYGVPLGPPREIRHGLWSREFENAIITVDETITAANITIRNPSEQLLYNL